MKLPSDLKDKGTWHNPRKKRFWALVLVVLYTLTGFFLVPWAIKKELPALAQKFLLRDAQVQEIRFNPWTLRLQANGFELNDLDGSKLASFDELVVNLQMRSIFQFALAFHEVSLTAPEFHLTRYAFADSNFGRMLNDIEAATKTAAPEEVTERTGLRLVIDKLDIKEGLINLSDEMPDTNFNTRLEPINISVTNLSTLPDKTGAQQINVTTETGSNLRWTGSLGLNPLVSSGKIEISGSPLPLIYRYFSDQFNFRLEDCCLDIALNYAVASATDGDIEAHISDISVSSRKLELRTLDTDDSIFQLPELRISGGDIKWPEKIIRIDELLLDKPDINIWIDNAGVLNLNTLLASQSVGEGSLAPSIPAEAGPSIIEADTAAPPNADMLVVEAEEVVPDAADRPANNKAITPSPSDQTTDWDISLAALRVVGLSLSFEDQSLPVTGKLTIPDAEIRITEISNQPDVKSPFAIAAQVGETGSIKLNGSMGIFPSPVLDAKLSVTGLSIPQLQPWAQQIASISINNGIIGMNGSLRSDSSETLGFLADIYIDNLGISDTLENEALLGWNRLDLEQTQLLLDAGRLEISHIKLDQPFARLVIADDGTTNFQALALDESDEPAQESQVPNNAANSEPAPAFVVQVGKTSINNGSMDFSDFSLPLPFSAPISKFGGELSALASDSQQPSDLKLEGQVGEYGSVNVGGSLNVMAPTDQANIEVVFRNISMPDLSPYTAEFAGRKIASGKLNLNLNYGFNNQKMVGENRIVLDKFELGEKVEHPEAMSLPLGLAVSLLRDVNGVIDLQLNVSGDLDDPEFSASGIILKAFANLITKLVAAPFKLLGGLIPGGENIEFDAVDFPPGRADLAPPEREKLDQLAQALKLRPSLLLTIPAGYNREADSHALQAIALDYQIDELLGEKTADEPEMLTRRTRKALEKLAKKQLPDLSLRELRKEFQREVAGESSFDEIAYVADLRQRLEQVQ
ncbi:MAG: DUF748 domain-containing protein, partial [Xanthomonadales bacterium]|nr:DUF748 domain-containing protein [Xanthomonadales bacterium]